jgi:peptidyl-prolyl cis-trans isomerase SDCCAG10
LNLFKAFKNKLGQIPAEERQTPENGLANPIDATNGHDEPKPGVEGAGADEEAVLCDLHFIANCQSCTKWDQSNPNAEDDADDLGSRWMSHKLSFAKDRLGKDLEWKRKNEEELVVIDPREKAKELGVERKKGRDERFMSDAKGGGSGGKREWDKGRERRR